MPRHGGVQDILPRSNVPRGSVQDTTTGGGGGLRPNVSRQFSGGGVQLLTSVKSNMSKSVGVINDVTSEVSHSLTDMLPPTCGGGGGGGGDDSVSLRRASTGSLHALRTGGFRVPQV